MDKTIITQSLRHIALHDYNVVIDSLERWDEAQFSFEKYSQIFILVDTNTAEHCLPVFQSSACFAAVKRAEVPHHIIEMQVGELHKNLDTCTGVWKKLMEWGADRQSLMINLGGGVVGDLGGFCASTFMRGMDFIQLPTSLLAMADSSVGGKTGVDFEEVKNYIGLFVQPKLVWIDPAFLATLPERELINGMAEVIKHAMIADRQLFDDLEAVIWQYDAIDWSDILMRSVQIKADIVAQDFKEKNVRKKLNFGHTVGHAIETYALSHGDDLLHGEAIVIGMLIESYISTVLTGLPLDHMNMIEAILLKNYGLVDISIYPIEDIERLLMMDKKKQGDFVGYTLLDRLGEAVVNQRVSSEHLADALKYYKTL